MKLLRNSILLLVIIIMEVLYFIIIQKMYHTELKSHLIEKVKENEIKTNSAINTFNLVSETVFTQIINQPKILELYSKANEVDSIETQGIRDSLYQILESTYTHLIKINIKQLHFHLPDNRSFLRFHRPDTYGDDLTLYRYSVKKANENFVPVQGFEEGKIYNGFRYVFPLKFNNRHIGTVETSFSFEAIRNQLQLLGITHSGFMLRADMVFSTVFKSEQENYVPSIISEEFVNEKKFLHYANDTAGFLKEIDLQIGKIIENELSKNKSFAVVTKFKNHFYLVTFIAIKNVENIPAAYIITYEKETNISFSKRQYYFTLFIGLLVIPILILLIYLYIESSEKAKIQNRVLLKSEEDLKTINKDLARLNATKDKFFSIIGHDLRNPFNSIIGLSEIIVEKSGEIKNEQINSFAKNIHELSLRTYELLENLLDWSRIQTGMIKPNFESLPLKSLMEKVISLHKEMAEQKEVQIFVEIADEYEILADKYMVETIFRNLVSNAIKYSFKNGLIQIAAFEKDNFIIISITDNGVGMKDNCTHHLLTDNYVQSENGTMGEKGTGLGLILCKEFITLNSGKIEVKKNQDQGTIFYIYLQKKQCDSL